MTQEQKRIKLAEAAGWKRKGKSKVWINPNLGGGFDYLSGLPNYFHDLNAVHELEKVLTEEQREQYAMLLSIRISGGGLTRIDGYTNYDDACNVITASATQRVEAIGLTLGLWTA